MHWISDLPKIIVIRQHSDLDSKSVFGFEICHIPSAVLHVRHMVCVYACVQNNDSST